MRTLFSIAIVIGLSGCAKPADPAADFQKFVKRYEELRGVVVPATVTLEVYDNMQVQSAADCIGSAVRVSPEYYGLQENQREMLILHELGHCVEKLPHTTELLSDGCPAEIMFYKSESEECYEKHYTELVDRFKKYGQG